MKKHTQLMRFIGRAVEMLRAPPPGWNRPIWIPEDRWIFVLRRGDDKPHYVQWNDATEKFLTDAGSVIDAADVIAWNDDDEDDDGSSALTR